MQTASDTDLLRDARGGDRQALGQLLARRQPQLWRFAQRMCRSRADAEDVVQEALTLAVRDFAQFRGDAALGTWLFSIARHACSRLYRRSPPGPRHAPEQDRPGSSEPAAGANDADPERGASARQLAGAVLQAIDELEPAQREALVLRDIEGLSATEVAEITGASVDAVKSRLHRARRNVQTRAAQIAEPRLLDPLPAAEPSTCPDILQLFSERLEGDLSPAMCERIQDHVDRCPACHGACEALKRTLAICQAVPLGPVPEHIQRAVERALRASPAAN